VLVLRRSAGAGVTEECQCWCYGGVPVLVLRRSAGAGVAVHVHLDYTSWVVSCFNHLLTVIIILLNTASLCSSDDGAGVVVVVVVAVVVVGKVRMCRSTCKGSDGTQGRLIDPGAKAWSKHVCRVITW
jgi:hypothetical protein